MSLHHDLEDRSFYSDHAIEEPVSDANHKRHIRKLLEDKLERKRLREEFDELDGEFDWEEYERGL